MLGVPSCSRGADPEPSWTPQAQGPSPAKRCCLQEPQTPPDLEEPAGSSSGALTSMVFLAAGCTLQLQLDGVDLLLEPDPTLVLEVSLPGHTIILVPEGLQASNHLEQPGFLSASPQGGAVLEMPEDHLLVLQHGSFCEYILESSYQEDACEFLSTSPQGGAVPEMPEDHLLVLQEGSFCEYILESSYQEDASDEDADSGLLSLWMDPSAGQESEHFSSIVRMPSPWPQGHIAEPYSSGPSPNTEPYSPRSIWDQDSYLLGPFPSSPLQPLPPSPPPSPQEQSPPFSSRAPCKARRRLFCQ